MEFGALLTAVLVVTAAVGGCSSKDRDGAGKAASGKEPGLAASEAPKREVAPSAEEVTKEARDLLARWLNSQNQGHLDEYAALYHPGRFTGIKRTSGGKTTKYDTARWLADRKRMFGGAMTVAAEQIAVRTWHSGEEPRLPAAVTEVRFLQRWKNDRYADHGPKVIRLLREQGRQVIVYEDLLSSRKGWDEAEAAQQEFDHLVDELERLDPPALRQRLDAMEQEDLAALFEKGPCPLALDVALAREQKGDPSLLPPRGEINEPDRIARALCLIGQLEDRDRQRALLVDYLPPSGSVKKSEDVCSSDENPDGTIKTEFQRGTATGEEIAWFGFLELQPCRPGPDRGEFVCVGIRNAVETAVTLSPGPDGKLYVTTIEESELTGCGC